jgi:hypothetical protein
MMYSLEHQTNFQGQRKCGENPDPVGPFILHAGPPIPPVLNSRSGYLHAEMFLLANLPGQKTPDWTIKRVAGHRGCSWPSTKNQSNEAPKSGDERYLAEHPMSWMCSALDVMMNQKTADRCNVR